jgi:hypothetical protein
MTNSILERKAQIERDREIFRALIKDSQAATQMINEQPAEYARLKAADRAGDPNARSGVRRGLEVRHLVETPKVHSDAEIDLMIQFPRETCERFYKPNLQTPDEKFILAKQSETARVNIRNASILHGIIVGELRYRSAEPPAVKNDDGRIEAGSLGALAGIPATERVTAKQYADLLAADGRRLAARSPSEVAQDHATALRIAADKAQVAADNAAKSSDQS